MTGVRLDLRLGPGSARVARMDTIQSLIGMERELDDVSRTLKYCVMRLHPPVVGALLVTCSDEAEQECADSFHKWFASDILPSAKLLNRAAFRTANLGARYEWGSIRVAEEHFAGAVPGHEFKVLVVKVNAHVAVGGSPDEPVYGARTRYDRESAQCGALRAVLDGRNAPFVRQLSESFASEGKDRIAQIRDESLVPPERQSLYAALVSARIQARHALLDIQDFTPTTPTFFYVLPCVSLNRPGPDGEIVVGVYEADCRNPDKPTIQYTGLGDDPSRYDTHHVMRRLRIEETDMDVAREARDHRVLVTDHLSATTPAIPKHESETLKKAVHEAVRKSQGDHSLAKAAIKTLLLLAAEVAPIPLAIVLFASGAVGIHNIHRMHRLKRRTDAHREAGTVIKDAHSEIDSLSDAQAQKLLKVLASHFGD